MSIINREFRVRVGEGRSAHFFIINQDEFGELSVKEIQTPRGPIARSIPLPEDVVNAMCDALETVKKGEGCLDDSSGSTGVTGVTGVTGTSGCTGFTFI